jgi:hypothetical protein
MKTRCEIPVRADLLRATPGSCRRDKLSQAKPLTMFSDLPGFFAPWRLATPVRFMLRQGDAPDQVRPRQIRRDTLHLLTPGPLCATIHAEPSQANARRWALSSRAPFVSSAATAHAIPKQAWPMPGDLCCARSNRLLLRYRDGPCQADSNHTSPARLVKPSCALLHPRDFLNRAIPSHPPCDEPCRAGPVPSGADPPCRTKPSSISAIFRSEPSSAGHGAIDPVNSRLATPKRLALPRLACILSPSAIDQPSSPLIAPTRLPGSDLAFLSPGDVPSPLRPALPVAICHAVSFLAVATCQARSCPGRTNATHRLPHDLARAIHQARSIHAGPAPIARACFCMPNLHRLKATFPAESCRARHRRPVTPFSPG